MSEVLCIYHGGCHDGIGAAYAVWKRHPKAAFYAAKYNEPHPNVKGKDVYIVDFSYKYNEMLQIADEANSVTVLDHHKTAEADLKSLLEDGTILGEFNMNKSGAVLTWEWLHSDPVPEILLYIQDRDLWRWHFPATKKISLSLSTMPTTDLLAWFRLFDNASIHDMAEQGGAIDGYYQIKLMEIIDATRREGEICGYRVPIANVPYFMASDAGNILCNGRPFSATYYDSDGHRNWSLRSTDNGVDVSLIAKQFGGGGHRNAAGFKTALEAIRIIPE